MSIADLHGIVPILPTPLTSDGEVDEAGLCHLVEFCARRGMDGVVVLGSTGEFPYLDFDAKRNVMATAVTAAAGRIPVIGSASARGTDEAVALARTAGEVGCDAVMAALPLYYAVGAEGVRRHFETLAREGELPVFYYHFPEVTGLVLTPGEIESIASIDGIVGAKLSVMNARFLRAVIQRTRPLGWRVFTGSTFLLDSCLRFGGAGVFCPLPLLAPDEVRALVDAVDRGERARARRLQAHLRRALPLMAGIDAPPWILALGFAFASRLPRRGPGRPIGAFHARLKEALRLRGHPIGGAVKRPFEPVTDAERALVAKTLEALGWLEPMD
jgi:4-hydroxy-tetrahydrodipicolinate synthase